MTTEHIEFYHSTEINSFVNHRKLIIEATIFVKYDIILFYCSLMIGFEVIEAVYV